MKKRILPLALAAFLALTSAAVCAAGFDGRAERHTHSDIVGSFEQLTRGLMSSAVRLGGEDDASEENYAYVCADAFVVGGGYLIKPIRILLQDNDTAATVFSRALELSGVTADAESSVLTGFKPRSIYSSGFPIDIEPELEGWLVNNKLVEYCDIYSWLGGQLGEGDITDLSGWEFFLNGAVEDEPMSLCEVKGGDVINLRFTIAAGMDLGGKPVGKAGEPYTEAVDLSALVRAVADGDLTYDSFAVIVNRAGVTQKEIDDIVKG